MASFRGITVLLILFLGLETKDTDAYQNVAWNQRVLMKEVCRVWEPVFYQLGINQFGVSSYTANSSTVTVVLSKKLASQMDLVKLKDAFNQVFVQLNDLFLHKPTYVQTVLTRDHKIVITTT